MLPIYGWPPLFREDTAGPEDTPSSRMITNPIREYSTNELRFSQGTKFYHKEAPSAVDNDRKQGCLVRQEYVSSDYIVSIEEKFKMIQSKSAE